MDRIRIYQLLPRLFGNVNETRRCNGTLGENGVGKFADINDTALSSLRAMGFTHLWLTGVLRHATGTDYSAAGLPADDPDLLKGLAGSPFAVTDLFDVCPDYAIDPTQRLAEFQALLRRIHANGLHVILDFIANHVARSYYSRVRSNLNFGTLDDRGKFFDPRNNFYYLRPDSPGGGPPLRLPTFADGRPISATCRVLGGCDGRFDSERDYGRVTGNNAATWAPSISDWYETAKLNYGYDFTSGAQEYPTAEHPEKPVPDTWMKMDAVLAYWQEMGVDGFRCDMAHMVPPEFWQWLVARARARQPEVFFAGEAYNNDPMKVGRGNVLHDLLAAGFDAVYDDPTYKILKGIYDGPKWANDLDGLSGDATLFTSSLRYAENHDEVRLAGASEWGGIGMQVGRPVSAILFGLSRGPVLLYSGQEVGEPAQGAEGFGADDARTSIFDYWSMPELVKWVNHHRYDGGRLSAEQTELRAFYARLLRLINEPAFRDGGFFGLNPANIQNARYGRLPEESASGHWLYAFLRYDATTGQRFLVLVNLHRQETFRNIDLWLPMEALQFLQLPVGSAWELRDQLALEIVSFVTANIRDEKGSILQISECRPLSACYFAWHRPAISQSPP
ncbi:alpha-amylase family protein [Chthoniobacter flavus]|nr:alpha-amylase family protein [Chthoniobacter flavus]